MSHELFYRCPCYVSGPGNITVVLLSMEGQRALRFHQKYLNLCSEDEQRSYGFGTTRGWVISDRIFIFGWTNPLMILSTNTNIKCNSLLLTWVAWEYLFVVMWLWNNLHRLWVYSRNSYSSSPTFRATDRYYCAVSVICHCQITGE